MAINAQELQGQWNELRGKVKEKWGQLSDDDLTVQGGNFDQGGRSGGGDGPRACRARGRAAA